MNPRQAKADSDDVRLEAIRNLYGEVQASEYISNRGLAMAKSTQDRHNQGQSDYGQGRYNEPHGELEKWSTWSHDETQKLVEDNKAYQSGYDNARSNDLSK